MNVNGQEVRTLWDAFREDLRWADDAMQPQEPIDWIVDNMIQAGSLNAIVGAPASYKTWLMLHMAICIADGQPFLGFFCGRKTLESSVLVIDEESGRRRLNHRLAGLMRGAHPRIDLSLASLSLARVNLRDDADWKILRQHVRDLGFKAMFIDALVDVMPGANENDVHEVQPIMMKLRNIAEDTGCAITFLHHENKDGRYRGSSAIEGAVDCMFQVKVKVGEPGKVDISTVKARDAEPSTMTARLVFSDAPFKVSVEGVPPEPVKAKLSAGEEDALRYLRENGASKINDIANGCTICSTRTMRDGVFKLAKKGLATRIDTGGKGEEATYDLTDNVRSQREYSNDNYYEKEDVF